MSSGPILRNAFGRGYTDMSESSIAIVLATGNPGKLRELEALLGELPLTLVRASSLGIDVEAVESGSSYAENARIKAVAYARASGMWSLADDTGLEVDPLGGAPGLRSARLVGVSATDADRRNRLLQLLAPHPRPWLARFRCIVALSDPGGQVELAEGICEGEILPEERGDMGFGYDPIFLVANSDRTMAELSLAEKNRLSHRAQAVRNLLPTLSAKMGLDR